MFTTPKRTNSSDMPAVPSHHATSAATTIARGVKVEGDFTSQGDVNIEGDVNGHITTSGMLTIGTDAKLKAEVTAAEAVIAGSIDGTVTITKRMELKSTAKIRGDVTCETIVVEAGAMLEGKVSVGVAPKNPIPAPSAKA